MAPLRTKTFTGCWTCRTRKIKCDLRKPTCERCEKANVVCEGYTIKLRWLDGGKADSLDEDQVQRRTVGFVEYPKDMVYKTYDEMDMHLSELHSPRFIEKETKMLGPFGVFVGIESTTRRPRAKRKQSSSVQANNNTSGYLSQGSSPSEVASNASKRSRLANSGGSDISTPETSSFGGTPSTAGLLHDSSFDTSSLIANHTHSHGASRHALHRNPGQQSHLQTYRHNYSHSSSPSTFNGIHFGSGMAVQQRSEYETLHEELTTLLDADITGPTYFDFTEFELDSTASNPSGLNSNGSTFQNTNTQGTATLIPPSSYHGVTASHSADNQNEPMLQTVKQEELSHISSAERVSSSTPVIHHVPRVFVKASETKVSPILDVMKWKKDRYFLSDEARALLYHYDKNVIRTMSVVAHQKNPWKTIFLPRSYSAIGNMVGKGQTSLARNALLHSMLAIGSFHVHTKVVGENPAQKAYFYEMGVTLRSEAYKYLTQCLKGDLSRQKYKDVVSAILSMVTTDVMCGVMEDCQVHLAACQSVISHRHKTRKRTSRKALILQRICGFLSLLQKATVLDPDSVLGLADGEEDDNDYDPSTSWMNIDLPDLTQTKHLTEEDHERTKNRSARIKLEKDSSQENINISSVSPDSDFVQQGEGQDFAGDDDDAELVSLQSLYGVPDSLVVLFNETCRVARQALYYRTDGDGPVPKKLEREVTKVQESLEAWQRTRYDVSAINFSGKVQEALRHHMLSFRDALLIYHYRLARGHSAEQVTKQVISILEHFEAMMSINANSDDPVITPLLFALFMGASEAVEPQHIDRYRLVCERMAIQGFGSYQTAYNVIIEVWRRRQEKVNGAEWWTVVREWNINIMLS